MQSTDSSLLQALGQDSFESASGGFREYHPGLTRQKISDLMDEKVTAYCSPNMFHLNARCPIQQSVLAA
jgi:hypothetical protein